MVRKRLRVSMRGTDEDCVLQFEAVLCELNMPFYKFALRIEAHCP